MILYFQYRIVDVFLFLWWLLNLFICEIFIGAKQISYQGHFTFRFLSVFVSSYLSSNLLFLILCHIECVWTNTIIALSVNRLIQYPKYVPKNFGSYQKISKYVKKIHDLLVHPPLKKTHRSRTGGRLCRYEVTYTNIVLRQPKNNNSKRFFV